MQNPVGRLRRSAMICISNLYSNILDEHNQSLVKVDFSSRISYFFLRRCLLYLICALIIIIILLANLVDSNRPVKFRIFKNKIVAFRYLCQLLSQSRRVYKGRIKGQNFLLGCSKIILIRIKDFREHDLWDFLVPRHTMFSGELCQILDSSLYSKLADLSSILLFST